MARLLLTGTLAVAALWGCAAPAPATSTPPTASTGLAASLVRYHCDNDIEFTVRFVDDTAVLDAGAHGNDVLLRDAGGATPQQTVYSNARMRAEFGLGVSGGEAILRYASPALAAHCRRE
jgi:hypothetical protein